VLKAIYICPENEIAFLFVYFFLFQAVVVPTAGNTAPGWGPGVGPTSGASGWSPPVAGTSWVSTGPQSGSSLEVSK
jgi:hypothetical protein